MRSDFPNNTMSKFLNKNIQHFVQWCMSALQARDVGIGMHSCWGGGGGGGKIIAKVPLRVEPERPETVNSSPSTESMDSCMGCCSLD